MKTLADFKTLINMKKSRNKTKEEKEISEKLLKFLNDKLGDSWENEKLLLTIKQFSNLNNAPFKTIFFLMTGKEHGIGLLELNEIYGKEFFINNLKS